MSFLSYVVCFLGVVLGGFWLLMIFSLLAMAQKGDEYQDQLEFALSQRQDLAPSLTDPGKSENIGSPSKSVPGQIGVSRPRMLIGR